MIDEIVRTDDINRLFNKLNIEAEAGGYHLNPDIDFTKGLIKGLIINTGRYGYPSCPCRLASGNENDDRDIVCPCDYRDPDLSDYGTCYCALYVTQTVFDGEKQVVAIPERRPTPDERKKLKSKKADGGIGVFPSLPMPIWRCKVCGYLCARDSPPEVCPICKAKKERFERFV